MRRFHPLLLTAMLVGGCSNANVDGPVVLSGLTPDSDSEDAEAVGTILLNGTCLELHAADQVFSVEWPDGTTWDDEDGAVVLSDGRRISDGDSIRGSGGYHEKSTQGCDTTTAVILNGDPNLIEVD